MTRRFLIANLALTAATVFTLSGCGGGGGKSAAGPTPSPSPSPTPTPGATLEPAVIFSAVKDGNRNLFRRDSSGAITPLTGSFDNDVDPDVSPDGARLLYRYVDVRLSNSRLGDLYVSRIDHSALVQLVSGGKVFFEPRFSPDSQRILYSENTGRVSPGTTKEITQIKTIRIDGTDAQVIKEGVELFRPQFSPDGTKIAYHDIVLGSNARYWVMNADGTSPVQIGDTNGYFVSELEWLPNGRLVLISTDVATSVTKIQTFLADGSDAQTVRANAPISPFGFRTFADGDRLLTRNLDVYKLGDNTKSSLSTSGLTDITGVAIVPGT